jgi:hypothetical protein
MNVINFERNLPVFEEHQSSPILAEVVARPMCGKGRRGQELPASGIVGNYAYRDGKARFLGVTSQAFKIVQMRDLTDGAERAMRDVLGDRALQNVKVTDRMANNGAFVERRYTIGDATRKINYRDAGIKVGTTVGAEFRIRTGFDGQTATALSTGTLDLSCLNGQVSLRNTDAFAKRHTKNATVEIFLDWIEDGLERFDVKMDHLQLLADTSVSFEQAKAVIHKLPGISEARAKGLVDRVETEMVDRGRNAYAVLSALTYYSSHNKDQFKIRNTGNDNVASTLAAREVEVTRWVRSDVFKSLHQAAA